MKKLIYSFLLAMIGMLSIPMTANADIYVIGNGEDMTWDLPGTQYTPNDDGTYTLELRKITNFQFSTKESNDWDEFNANAYFTSSTFTNEVYGDNGQTLALTKEDNTDTQRIELPWLGDYTITINLKEMTINAKTTTPAPPLKVYIRGGMNDWNASEEWMMKYDEENDYYTFDCSDHIIPARCEFKFADDMWDKVDFGIDSSDYHGLFPVTDLNVDMNYRPMYHVYFLTGFDGQITFKITSDTEANATFTASSNEYTKDYLESNGIIYKILSDSQHTLSVVKLSPSNNAPTTVAIPESIDFNNATYSVEEIESNAFANYETIKSVTLPESLKSIGFRAFYQCRELASINIPESVISIGSLSFSGCSNLVSVIIPEGITSLANSLFYDCPKLSTVNIPETVTSIGDDVFYRCSSLRTIDLPDNLTSIGITAFFESGIESISLPATLTSIGNAVFENCTHLQSIAIPASLTTIPTKAFSGCVSLSSVEFNNGLTEIGEGAFYDCSNIKSLILPKSLNYIGEGAFMICSSLNNVSIPANVTTLNQFTFAYCTSLKDLYVYSVIPPSVIGDVFLGVPTGATMHVPVGTKEAYFNTHYYPYLFNIVDDLELDDEDVEEPEIPDTCVSMTVNESSIELAVDEETELIVNLKGLKVGTSTLTLTLTGESGEETTETVVISVVKNMTDVTDLFGKDEERLVNIYNLNGILLKRNVRPETVLELSKGLYIVGDKKVMVK